MLYETGACNASSRRRVPKGIRNSVTLWISAVDMPLEFIIGPVGFSLGADVRELSVCGLGLTFERRFVLLLRWGENQN